jgi:predicted alpha-1,2-mannosidase
MRELRNRTVFVLSLSLLLACGSSDGDAPTDTSSDLGPSDLGDVAQEEVEVTPVARVIDEVNLHIGTDNFGFAFGASYPGVTLPFGLIQPGPDTAGAMGNAPILHTSGYFYQDEFIDGFSHGHVHGIGAADYGHVLMMPTLGMDASKTREKGYRSAFSHEEEELWPGYYAVRLADTDVRAELTATERAAMHRYTFHPGDDAVVIVDLGHAAGGVIDDAALTLDPEARRIEGWCILHGALSGRHGGIKTYVSITFEQAMEAYGTWTGEELHEGGATADVDFDEAGVRLGAWVAFDVSDAPVVQARVGMSFIDEAAARANAEAEIDHWDFDRVREGAEGAWEELLGAVAVEGGTPAQRTSFYTSLYHSYLMPQLFTDADGRYRGFDEEVRQADGFRFYSNFSLWDTYRTLHSLLVLLVPDVQRDMMVSLLKMYEQDGFLPRWPIGLGEGGSMVGESAFIVLADSLVKGVDDWDHELALEAMLQTSAPEPPKPPAARRRDCLDAYLSLGYCPVDAQGGSTSKTMEYAYDDFAVAQLARAIGRDDVADDYAERATWYKNLWNPDTGFFQGRHSDGSFAELDPEVWEDYFVEGDAWHYLFFVPHDPDGLAEVFGGADALIERLDFFFESSVPEQGLLFPGVYYWHGNEPDLHTAWLYAELGRPDQAQRWSRWILDNKYHTGPSGLDGNDDCGTLSAWYVFTALGFYPVPARDYYLLGSPVFERATLRLPGGELVVRAEGASPEAIYVQSVTWDGEPLTQPRVAHAELASGGELVFVMGTEPSSWGR